MTTYSEKENLPLPLVRPLRRTANRSQIYVQPVSRSVLAPSSSRSPSVAVGAVSALDPFPRSAGRDHSATPDSMRDGWFARGVDLEREETATPRVGAGIYPNDRLSPGLAGGLLGAVAATASLGIVHAMAPALVEARVASVAAARGVDLALTFALAYGSVAGIGGLVGTTFAIVTRYLRKWFALLVWSLVFFVSLGMLLLTAISSSSGGSTLAAPVLALRAPVLLASAVFAVLVSLSLPIRRRR